MEPETNKPDPFQYKMCIEYFDNKVENVNLNDIVTYLINKYKFTAKRHKYGNDIFKYVQKDIASVLNLFCNQKQYAQYKNFTREMTKNGYLYKSSSLETNYVLPKQTEFNFEEHTSNEIYLEDEIINMNKTSPLFEDVKAAEHINNQNLFQPLIEQMNIYNLEELNFTRIENNKKIQVTITNA